MSEKAIKILVIDDEEHIISMLKLTLEACDYIVEGSLNAYEGIHLIKDFNPDILLLDLSLPDMDGKDVVTHIREWSHIPIIILSARGSENEKIAALDAGADDYLTKPFNMGELLARIRAQLRHAGKDKYERIFISGGLEIDFELREVKVEGRNIRLTPTQFDILKLLAQNSGKVVTYSQILKAVWGYVNNREKHYVRIYISQLRQKIESDSTRPVHIITESGIGYRLI